MKKQQSITSLPVSPDAERHSRMIRYSIAMGIRLVCVVCVLFFHEWWELIIFGTGAVLLPYFAVVIANVSSRRGRAVERPGSIEVYRDPVYPRQRETGGRPE